ncbi:MAG: hypothetical protein R3229_13695 [Alphaproteobacteria bacterium]|nr:hypothetical protein [Alphaproteobacteria bacterium]
MTEIIARRAWQRLGYVVMLPSGDALFVYPGFAPPQRAGQGESVISNYLHLQMRNELRRASAVIHGLRGVIEIFHLPVGQPMNLESLSKVFWSRPDERLQVRARSGEDTVPSTQAHEFRRELDPLDFAGRAKHDWRRDSPTYCAASFPAQAERPTDTAIPHSPVRAAWAALFVMVRGLNNRPEPFVGPGPIVSFAADHH